MGVRVPIVTAALLALGCASNPPLDESAGRGLPQVAQDWDDAGQGSGFDAGAPLVAGDAGRGRAGDAGGAGAAGAPDAGANDAGPSEEVDCGAFASMGYEVCASFASACEIIFRDGIGCTSACARAGLVCEDSWNDESGTCAPQRRQHYGCRESGHDSDYCVCVSAR